MWEDYGALRSHREAAELLAEHDWPRLYDAGPAAPATRSRSRRRSTSNDLYVERDFAEETAAAIRGLRPWITNEFEHNGLRADGERVLGRLHRPGPRTRLTRPARTAMGQIALATRRPSRTASSTVRGARQSPIPWTSPANAPGASRAVSRPSTGSWPCASTSAATSSTMTASPVRTCWKKTAEPS